MWELFVFLKATKIKRTILECVRSGFIVKFNNRENRINDQTPNGSRKEVHGNFQKISCYKKEIDDFS